MKIIFLSIFLIVAAEIPALGWVGYDYETDSYIEIESGNLVRRNNEIEIYDEDYNGYKNVEILDITNSGQGVEIEVFDPELDDIRTFEMEE